MTPRRPCARRRAGIVRGTALAIALAAGALLSGCSAAAAAIDSGTAKELQSSVVTIANAAAAGDAAGATAALDGLQAQLDAGLADESIGADRGAAIRAAIDLVRADLAAAAAPTVAPSEEAVPEESETPEDDPSPEETPTPEETPVPEETAVDTPTPTVESPAPSEEPAPEPSATDSGPGSSDKDKPCNGNGNSKGCKD